MTYAVLGKEGTIFLLFSLEKRLQQKQTELDYIG